MAAGHVPGQANDVLRPPAGLRQHADHVGKRGAHLRRELEMREFLLRVPADLAGDEHLRSARRDAVRVSLGPRPFRRLQYLVLQRKTSRPMMSFCTSVAPS